MKTFKKTAIAAFVILLALFLVTCVEDLPESLSVEYPVEWVDWQYEDMPDGSGRMTLMLDGTKPFAYRQQRSLGLELARMSHDYFEVIFVGAGGLTDGEVGTGVPVARASWEIGEPAGISGVTRGIDYGAVFPAAGTPASVIFVGKKTGKTLLGIGHLIQVKEGETVVVPPASPVPGDPTRTTITSAATSVTFGVYPLTTKIGIASNGLAITTPDSSFLTAATSKTATGNLTGPTPALTFGTNASLRGGVSYPAFGLPDAENGRTIAASYTIGGMAADAAATPVAKPALLPSARVITTTITGGTPETFGLEVIKRTPSYEVGGTTFDATGSIDMYTKVVATSHNTAHAAFADTMTMTFTQDTQSQGIFAITFQCPVYAITQSPATNSGPGFVRWYIRPGYQRYQYLLDNGIDAGGAVMIGTNAGDIDWLDIFTVGIGFSN